ncbi:MAG: ribonuclease P [Candidatus Altiarchaeales archaeon ex4484_2]|nr:MAG: ribonuclease P [Candidatus Altiarchaeales archaeon ex4484_2]
MTFFGEVMPLEPLTWIQTNPSAVHYLLIKMTKPLPPTLREKSRYLVLEFRTEKRLSRRAVSRALWNSVLGFLGELGASRLNLWLIDWDLERNKGIIKVTRESVDDVRASISLIREVEGVGVVPRIASVSGTLKKARIFLES